MIVVAETKEDRVEAVHEGGGQLAQTHRGLFLYSVNMWGREYTRTGVTGVGEIVTS
jgi:hypothetical protein